MVPLMVEVPQAHEAKVHRIPREATTAMIKGTLAPPSNRPSMYPRHRPVKLLVKGVRQLISRLSH